MTEHKEEDFWGREKARKLYGREGMVGADVAATRKNAGSNMVHYSGDTAREPKLEVYDSPRDCLEKGYGGEKYIKPSLNREP